MNTTSICALVTVAWVVAVTADSSKTGETNRSSYGGTNDVTDTYWAWQTLVEPSRDSAAYGGVVESLLWDRVIWSRDVALLMQKKALVLTAKDAKPLREFNRELSLRSDPWGDMLWIGFSNDVQRVDRISQGVMMLKVSGMEMPMMPCPQAMADVVALSNDILDKGRRTGMTNDVEKVVLWEGCDWVTNVLVFEGHPLVRMLWMWLVTSDADVRLDGKTLVIFRREAKRKSKGPARVQD
jgi:hypothetical protein